VWQQETQKKIRGTLRTHSDAGGAHTPRTFLFPLVVPDCAGQKTKIRRSLSAPARRKRRLLRAPNDNAIGQIRIGKKSLFSFGHVFFAMARLFVTV